MIKKIPDLLPVQTAEWNGTTFDIIPRETFAMACRKINELVDAINPILEERESQIKVYEETMEMVKRNDPYAEQRKWIGKLCRFWNDEDDGWEIFSKLKHIYYDRKDPFETTAEYCYRNCEPVSPDDDIIYKGEQQ